MSAATSITHKKRGREEWENAFIVDEQSSISHFQRTAKLLMVDNHEHNNDDDTVDSNDDNDIQDNISISSNEQQYDEPNHTDDSIDESSFYCHYCENDFTSLSSFDLHYQYAHRFTCSICSYIFPIQKLLDIHFQERHDQFFKLLSQTKKMVNTTII